MKYPFKAYDRKQARMAVYYSFLQYLRILHSDFKNSLKLVMETASYPHEDRSLLQLSEKEYDIIG